jgi:hypothetical protein
MVDKTEQSDRAPNPNEKPEICYCSALPKGSGPCLPCYTRWLGGSAKTKFRPTISNIAVIAGPPQGTNAKVNLLNPKLDKAMKP